MYEIRISNKIQKTPLKRPEVKMLARVPEHFHSEGHSITLAERKKIQVNSNSIHFVRREQISRVQSNKIRNISSLFYKFDQVKCPKVSKLLPSEFFTTLVLIRLFPNFIITTINCLDSDRWASLFSLERNTNGK